MFRSARRDVVFPQTEHARLAASIALLWGNTRFAPAPLPAASFVAGVAFHDRGYEPFDTDGIGEVPSERWLEIQQESFRPRGEDAVVDLVVAMHVRRLLSSQEDDHERAAYDEVDRLVASLLEQADVSRQDAETADAITNVCDVISFEFCFEAPSERDVRGHRVVLDGQGRVTVDPWPFALPRLLGLVTAFAADDYPDRLVPVVAPYDVRL